MSAIIKTLLKHDQQESKVNNTSNSSNRNNANMGPAEKLGVGNTNPSLRQTKSQKPFNSSASPDSKKSAKKPSIAIIKNFRETKCLVRSLY